jgi:hypothetical protein
MIRLQYPPASPTCQRSVDAKLRLVCELWRSLWICDKGGNDEQHREDSSVAKLLRLSLAALTFLFFFYSTTLLTSYFYPLDWAPVAF